MKKAILISIGLFCFILFCRGQDTDSLQYRIPADTTVTDTAKIPETGKILATDTLDNAPNVLYEPEAQSIDTTRSIYYWRITERTGEMIEGSPDTILTDYPNRMSAEGKSVSIAYPGNMGLPMESRIFFERPERSNFMFFDPYQPFTRSPDKFNFINTRIPYSSLTYLSGGGQTNKEERLLGELSINFGKELNVGFDIDYLYSRGHYESQAAKHLDWVFYSSYISDRHRLHLFINPASYTSAENGGIDNDQSITDPMLVHGGSIDSRSIPTKFANTWNRLKSNRYYLNYRYNLGFERDTDRKDADGNSVKQFVPVSSLIYTFDYVTTKRTFDSRDSLGLDSIYDYDANKIALKRWGGHMNTVDDSTSHWQLRNTLALSLREGFSSWAKFDLTAFITQDIRKYTLLDSIPMESLPPNQQESRRDSAVFGVKDFSENSTYIGGELIKRTGKILRYNARASFGVLGENLGDFDISGNIETRIPLFRDTASITGTAYTKNLEPSFYEKHYRGRYFWWDNDLEKIKKQYIGGKIDFPQTKTNLEFGVENITNYTYFDYDGTLKQFGGDLQVYAATLQQNIKLGALHWNNQIVYQHSGNEDILPLPDWSIYSNLFIEFMIAKVLTVQMGGNLHYFTKYDSPIYDPVLLQFRLQDKESGNYNYVQVGDYPLINGYINCHLKQTRFFVEFYNIGTSFIKKPAYFSLPHYPINPMVFKFGLTFTLKN